MTNYRRGRAFEYEAKKLLEDEGYCVCRTAGSHSPFDLIALSRLEVKCIQCKYAKSKKPWFGSEIKKLEQIDVPKHVVIELWIKRVGSKEIEVIPVK
jgi:Holliday junction resolvase